MSLRFEDVTVAYGGREVLHGVRFALSAGDVCGLIGPNGAGKTTLLRVAAGLIRPLTGRVAGASPLIYFGGETTLPGACRANRWAGLLGGPVVSRKPVGRLSRGTRQLVGLNVWLSRDDWRVGLLDEPWEGLDPIASRWLADAISRHRRRGATLLISSHRLHDVAGVCSTFAFLADGRYRPLGADDLSCASTLDGAALARAFEVGFRR